MIKHLEPWFNKQKLEFLDPEEDPPETSSDENVDDDAEY